MLDRYTDIPRKNLNQKDIIITNKKVVISTILGSCVSITMFAKEYNLSGICHAYLPKIVTKYTPINPDIYVYVDSSITYMYEVFMKRHIPPESIEVKLLGGSCTHMTSKNTCYPQSVGKKNIETALKTLNNLGLHIKAKDVGGKYGRKLYFVSFTGEVFVKKMRSRER